MKELRMTIVCKACNNQFGAWRTHCPACNESVPRSVRDAMLAPRPSEVGKAPREPKHRRVKNVRHQCTFCRRANADERCPHCNEEIHAVCRRLHDVDCALFQVEREAELRKLAPNALENPAGLGRHIDGLLKGGRP